MVYFGDYFTDISENPDEKIPCLIVYDDINHKWESIDIQTIGNDMNMLCMNIDRLSTCYSQLEWSRKFGKITEKKYLFLRQQIIQAQKIYSESIKSLCVFKKGEKPSLDVNKIDKLEPSKFLDHHIKSLDVSDNYERTIKYNFNLQDKNKKISVSNFNDSIFNIIYNHNKDKNLQAPVIEETISQNGQNLTQKYSLCQPLKEYDNLHNNSSPTWIVDAGLYQNIQLSVLNDDDVIVDIINLELFKNKPEILSDKNVKNLLDLFQISSDLILNIKQEYNEDFKILTQLEKQKDNEINEEEKKIILLGSLVYENIGFKDNCDYWNMSFEEKINKLKENNLLDEDDSYKLIEQQTIRDIQLSLNNELLTKQQKIDKINSLINNTSEKVKEFLKNNNIDNITNDNINENKKEINKKINTIIEDLTKSIETTINDKINQCKNNLFKLTHDSKEMAICEQINNKKTEIHNKLQNSEKIPDNIDYDKLINSFYLCDRYNISTEELYQLKENKNYQIIQKEIKNTSIPFTKKLKNWLRKVNPFMSKKNDKKVRERRKERAYLRNEIFDTINKDIKLTPSEQKQLKKNIKDSINADTLNVIFEKIENYCQKKR